MGTSPYSILKIEDETGHMTVLCPDTAIGSRETQIRRQYEIEVEPVKEQPLFDGICEVVNRHMCKAVIRHLILRE